MKRDDNQMLVLTHLSQLLDLVTGFGGLIAPLVLWLTQKDKVLGMDEHGKMILNFKLSLLIYCFVCIPVVIFTLGLGIVFYVVLGIISLILPIINAYKVNRGGVPSYPLSLNLIK